MNNINFVKREDIVNDILDRMIQGEVLTPEMEELLKDMSK